MRKAILFVPLVLVLAVILAPNAKADTVSFSGGFSTPPSTSASISGTDAITLGSITEYGDVFTFAGLVQASATPYTDSYSWSFGDLSFIFGVDAFTFTDNTTGSSVTDYVSDFNGGIFFDGGSATISGTSAAAPEPGTFVLLLAGIGLLFVMRKRIARSAMQAA